MNTNNQRTKRDGLDCDWFDELPGPHPGCAEFALEPEIFECSNKAANVVEGLDVFGESVAVLCEHHTPIAVQLLDKTTVTPIDEHACTYCHTFGHPYVYCPDRPLDDEELHYLSEGNER